MKKIIVLTLVGICMCLLNISVLCADAYADANTITIGDAFYVIKSNNSLWRGEIMNMDTDDRIQEFYNFTEIAQDVISVKNNYFIKNDYSLWEYDSEQKQCKKIGQNIVSVEANSEKLFVLKQNGKLYVKKLSTYSNKNTDTEDDDFIQIAEDVSSFSLGSKHAIILKNDGSVWTLGNNSYGQLGINDKNVKQLENPVKIASNADKVFASANLSYFIDDSGMLWRCGTPYASVMNQKNNAIYAMEKYAENVESADCYDSFTLVLKKDCSLWVYGDRELALADEYWMKSDNESFPRPNQILQNVNCIAKGYSNSFITKTLVLNNSGELIAVGIDTYPDGKLKCTTQKIMDGIKLSNTEKYNKLEVFNINGEIQIHVNGKEILFENVKPFIDDNGRTQLPIRIIAETIGTKVEWSESARTALITGNGATVTFTIGSDVMNINESNTKMDTTTLIVNDHMYVPIRFIAEAFGLTVEWKS